jgi:homoserine O-acetyltransferase
VSAALHPDTLRFEAGDLRLESGGRLRDAVVAYRTWGRLAPGGSNAVLVEHALTGSANVDEWWPDLIGSGRVLDPARDFVVCANALGSCYGTTGPASGSGPDFPSVTLRDMVALEAGLADHLGVSRWSLVIGGSLGGMRALEWAASLPARVASVVALGAPGKHSAWAIGWSAIARKALSADPAFREGRYPTHAPPHAGLAAARAVSMMSYRSPESLEFRFGRREEDPPPRLRDRSRFEIEAWLDHHGESFVRRFDANSWLALSRAMDTHDLARSRASSVARALIDVRIPALIVGISSDALYPCAEVERLARDWPGATFARLESPHGHDAFLIEQEQVEALIRSFRIRTESGAARPRLPRDHAREPAA